LLPESPRSMACYHAKVMEDGIMKLTIHDCKGSIQLHNDLNDPQQVQEAIDKLETLAAGIYELQFFIAKHYTHGLIHKQPKR
jgi:5-hydroxyisourate hydrolase-like protein (transthyretin family)